MHWAGFPLSKLLRAFKLIRCLASMHATVVSERLLWKVPEDADEERLHAINPLPAVFPGVGGFAVGILGQHTPAQVQVEELRLQLLDPLAQLREKDDDQMVPLRVQRLGRFSEKAGICSQFMY